jgi:hypothetical protein
LAESKASVDMEMANLRKTRAFARLLNRPERKRLPSF